MLRQLTNTETPNKCFNDQKFAEGEVDSMRSFSHIGLRRYLLELGEFNALDVLVLESPSRYYRVCLHQLQDLERLTKQAIFSVDC